MEAMSACKPHAHSTIAKQTASMQSSHATNFADNSSGLRIQFGLDRSELAARNVQRPAQRRQRPEFWR